MQEQKCSKKSFLLYRRWTHKAWMLVSTGCARRRCLGRVEPSTVNLQSCVWNTGTEGPWALTRQPSVSSTTHTGLGEAALR